MPNVLWYKSILMGVPSLGGGKRLVSMDHTPDKAEAWAAAILKKESSPSAYVQIFEVIEIPFRTVSKEPPK